LVVSVSVAALLLPAASSLAAVGSDSYSTPAPLLFSVAGTVASNLGYTTQGGEPVAATVTPPCPAMSKTAWWRITGNGQPIALTTGASNFDTVLAVYDAPTGTPIADNQVACNDNAAGVTTSALTFSSVRGKAYLVQVGSRGVDFGISGMIDVKASSTRPANDDRVNAQLLSTGTAAAVSNAGASQELGELLTCAPNGYAATIWFGWTSPGTGDATFAASAAFETVVTVLRASDGTVLGCASGAAPSVPLRVAAGDYIVQVGSKGADVAALPTDAIATTASFTLDPDLDNDGALKSSDCNDLNASIRPGIVDIPDDGIDQNCDGADAINRDRDSDGYSRPGDCNDADARIHPQAKDIPGNTIDEDCTAGPAPYPLLASVISLPTGETRVRNRGGKTRWRVRLVSLSIRPAVAGSTVRLSCRGKGCHRFKPVTSKVTKSAVSRDLSKLLPKRRPAVGAKFEVRVTKPGTIGRVLVITVFATKRPTKRNLCLEPGKTKPAVCKA